MSSPIVTKNRLNVCTQAGVFRSGRPAKEERAPRLERWGHLLRGDAAELVPSVPGAWNLFYPAFARGRGWTHGTLSPPRPVLDAALTRARREERVTVTLLLTAGILAGAGAG